MSHEGANIQDPLVVVHTPRQRDNDCLSSGDTGKGYSDPHNRTRAPDAPVQATLKLQPMRSRATELVSGKAGRPCLPEGASIAFHVPLNGIPLPCRWLIAELRETAERTDPPATGKLAYPRLYAILERLPAGDDHSHADRTVGMKTVEVFQIPIEKWIFIVPFDLKSNCAICTYFDVVDFVRFGKSCPIVDFLLNVKRAFLPLDFVEVATQPLRNLGLTAATPNELDDGNGYTVDYPVQLFDSFEEIVIQYSICVIRGLDIKVALS